MLCTSSTTRPWSHQYRQCWRQWLQYRFKQPALSQLHLGLSWCNVWSDQRLPSACSTHSSELRCRDHIIEYYHRERIHLSELVMNGMIAQWTLVTDVLIIVLTIAINRLKLLNASALMPVHVHIISMIWKRRSVLGECWLLYHSFGLIFTNVSPN